MLVKELHASQKTAAEKWLQKGIALYDLKRNEEALEAFETVTRLNPKFASANNGKAVALYHLGRSREAE